MAPKLKLTEPLKLHILVHVLEFCAKFKCTPAAYGKQDRESLHRCFNPETVSSQNVVRIRYAVSVSKNNLE